MLNKKSFLTIILACALVFALYGGAVAAQRDLEKVLNDRVATLYVEGQPLGNMIIGARAKLEFIYVDGVLVRAVKDDERAPSWLEWHVNKYGSDEAKGKKLFILRVETFKPFTLMPEMIAVNGFQLKEENILTRKEFAPLGELPSSFKGAMVLAVPGDLVKPGKEVRFSCGSDEAVWVVPKK